MVEHLLPELREKVSLRAGPRTVACEAHSSRRCRAHRQEHKQRRHFAAVPAADHAVDQVAQRERYQPVEGHFQRQAGSNNQER